MSEEYGHLTFQSSEPVVIGVVPRLMCVQLDWLLEHRSHGISVIGGDMATFGRHQDGGLVWYKVVGWDPVQKGLVLQLDGVMLGHDAS